MAKWFKTLGIKVIKTMSETALGLIGTTVFIQDISWLAIGSATLLSGIITILMNLKDLKVEE